MPVGSFPGMEIYRKTIPAQVNPLDKATIFSIYPKPIFERKISLMPGEFLIPAGSYDKPGILVIGTSSWWKDVGEDQPLLEIPQSAIVVADAVVRDYCNGLLAFDSNASLGLSFLPGEVSLVELKTKFKDKLERALTLQKNWYAALVKMADIGWSRTNGNPLAINDDMRLAAQELGLEKEWIKDFRNFDLTRCVACGYMRNPNFPICPNCKNVIDAEKAKQLGLKFVE